MTLFGLGLCGGLLVISAFFSAAEIALFSLPPEELKRLALRNPSLRNSIHTWMTRPQKFIITILVGNTLTDVAFTAGLTGILLQALPYWPQHAAEGLAWGAGALATTLLGEILPKILGRRRPGLIGYIAFPALGFFEVLFNPLLAILETALAPFLKALPSHHDRELRFSADELMTMLTGSDRDMEISPEVVGMMKRTLEINKKSARDIMTPIGRVEALDWARIVEPGDTDIDLFIEQGHSRVPVIKNGEFIGVLYSKDILAVALKERPEGLSLSTLVRPLHTVEGAKPVAELLIELENKGIAIAMVRGPDKKAIGLITHEDILEEITGEILDEYDS